MDSTYASLFSDTFWKDTFDKTDPSKPSLGVCFYFYKVLILKLIKPN